MTWEIKIKGVDYAFRKRKPHHSLMNIPSYRYFFSTERGDMVALYRHHMHRPFNVGIIEGETRNSVTVNHHRYSRSKYTIKKRPMIWMYAISI